MLLGKLPIVKPVCNCYDSWQGGRLGRIFASVLWIVLSCQSTLLKDGVSSFNDGETWFEMRVENGIFGSNACVVFLNSVSMTSNGECMDATMEENQEVILIRFIVQAGVGDVEYTIRIQNDVVKIPGVGHNGFVEGVLQPQPL